MKNLWLFLFFIACEDARETHRLAVTCNGRILGHYCDLDSQTKEEYGFMCLGYDADFHKFSVSKSPVWVKKSECTIEKREGL